MKSPIERAATEAAQVTEGGKKSGRMSESSIRGILCSLMQTSPYNERPNRN